MGSWWEMMHNAVHITSLSATLLKCGGWLAFPARVPTEVVIQSPGRSFVMHFFTDASKFLTWHPQFLTWQPQNSLEP